MHTIIVYSIIWYVRNNLSCMRVLMYKSENQFCRNADITNDGNLEWRHIFAGRKFWMKNNCWLLKSAAYAPSGYTIHPLLYLLFFDKARTWAVTQIVLLIWSQRPNNIVDLLNLCKNILYIINLFENYKTMNSLVASFQNIVFVNFTIQYTLIFIIIYNCI